MPRQNRVTPFGELIATPARGTLTGNRGCLHDAHPQIRRSFQGQRWIICLLDFKGRSRQIMRPGHYTELFFLDEATALAAGHRPCAECQRPRFDLFRRLWVAANGPHGAGALPSATEIDAALHGERWAAGGRPIAHGAAFDALPDGTFVADDGGVAYLILAGQALQWTPEGYRRPPGEIDAGRAQIITPASIVRVLAAGYPAGIHRSAGEPA